MKFVIVGAGRVGLRTARVLNDEGHDVTVVERDPVLVERARDDGLTVVGGDGSQAGYIAIAALAGMLIGTLYEISGNFAVPWIVHAAWNVLVYLNLYLGATGGL